MKKLAKIIGGLLLAAAVLAVIAAAVLYATFCGGHPHGLC